MENRLNIYWYLFQFHVSFFSLYLQHILLCEIASRILLLFHETRSAAHTQQTQAILGQYLQNDIRLTIASFFALNNHCTDCFTSQWSSWTASNFLSSLWSWPFEWVTVEWNTWIREAEDFFYGQSVLLLKAESLLLALARLNECLWCRHVA